MKRFRETSNCLPKVRNTPINPVRTNKLINKAREGLQQEVCKKARSRNTSELFNNADTAENITKRQLSYVAIKKSSIKFLDSFFL